MPPLRASRLLFSALFLSPIFLILQSCKSGPKAAVGQNHLAVQHPERLHPDFSWRSINYDTTKTYVYLTFDDGPLSGTSRVLHIVDSLQVKATFFMVGMHAWDARLKRLVDTIRNSYPQILLANHSYTHALGHYHAFYHHPEAAEQDFLRAQDSLHVPFRIIRLPGNSSWVREGELKCSGLVRPVNRLLDSLGYNVIGWDMEWNFNKKGLPVQSADTMIARMNRAVAEKTGHTHDHIVLLSHDHMFRDQVHADSLSKFIAALKKNPAIVLETIDHYPGLRMPGHSINKRAE